MGRKWQQIIRGGDKQLNLFCWRRRQWMSSHLFWVMLLMALPHNAYTQVVRPNMIDKTPPSVISQDEIDEDGLRSGDILNDELAYTQAEQLGDYTQYFHLALGYTRPWQIWSFGGSYLLDAQMHLGYFAGTARTNEEGRHDDRSLDISISSYSTGGFFRYYLERFPHIFLESQLAYAAWNGTCRLNGTTPGGNTADNISVSYNYSGLNIGGNVGVYWLLGKHFVVEWVPLSVGTSVVLQRSTGRDANMAKKAIEQRLERPRLMGLMNISLGYLF